MAVVPASHPSASLQGEPSTANPYVESPHHNSTGILRPLMFLALSAPQALGSHVTQTCSLCHLASTHHWSSCAHREAAPFASL